MTFNNLLLFTITLTLSMNSVMSLLGGVKQTDVRVCRSVLNKSDLKEDAYLRKYVIVSCTKQVVAGMKYSMIVRPVLTSSVSVQIDVWAKLDKTFEATVGEEQSSDNEDFEGLDGGFRRVQFKTCEKALGSADLQSSTFLKTYVVIDCETQVVNGMNYKMTVVHTRHPSLRRNIVIFSQDQTEYSLSSDKTDFLPAVEEKQVLMGGFQDNEISQCEDAIKLLSQEEQAKFDNSEVVECETQVVAGINFKMVVQDREMRSHRAKVVIFRGLPDENDVQHASLTQFDLYLDESANEQMTGAMVGQPKIEECFDAIRSVDRDELTHILNMKLLKCEKQVVNGMNYKLTLQMVHIDETCSVVIYNEAGQDKFEVVDREDADDCHVKLDQ